MYNTAELFTMASKQETTKEAFLNNVTLSIKDDADGGVDLDAEKFRIEKLWNIAKMPFKEMIALTGMTQRAFAKGAGVPERTMQNWCAGIRECPEYVKMLLAEHYKLI